MTSGPNLIPYPPPPPYPYAAPPWPSPAPWQAPPPPEPQSPPPPRPVSVYIAWVVILAAAAITIIMNIPRLAELEQETGPSLEMEISARSSLGMKQLFDRWLPISASDNEQTLSSLRADAKTPLQRLCLIPAISELVGDQHAADAAMKLSAEAQLPDSVRDDVEAMKQLYSDPHATLPPDVSQRLIERYGFFGKLAAAHGRSANDPIRQEVIRAELRTVYALSALFVGFSLAFLGGIPLMIVLLIALAKGRSPPQFRPAADRVADILLEGFAVWMALFVILEALPRKLFANVGPAGNFLLVVPFVGAIVWILARGVGWSEMTQALGWQRGRGVLREMLAGAKFYLAGVPMMAFAFVLTIILSYLGNTKGEHPIEKEVHGSPHVIALMLFLACIFAPITEETLFRGMLLGHMRRRHSWILSALFSSVLFAAIHPQGWTVIPMLSSVAMVLATIREQRRSIIGSMTAHAIHNLWVSALLFTMVS